MPTKTKAPAKKKAAGPVRVRMYRHGLGDSFLLRFPKGDGSFTHIVIDSGVIKGTQSPKIRMMEVAEDIERETGGKIDILVVTHEHWDHVSGFMQAREVWERLNISEIWLAWTEDPADAEANKIRQERAERADQIVNALRGLARGSALQMDSVRGQRIQALVGFLGFGLGAAGPAGGGTKEALDFIVGRAAKKTFHLPGGSFERADLPGVRVFVLGPPKDSKRLKKSDPTKSKPEVYPDPREAFGFAVEGGGDAYLPFPDGEHAPVRTPAEYDAALASHFPRLVEHGPDPAWRRISVANLAEIEALALALDGDTNNTSLALAFELADGRVLLFPADAQVGNWLSWHDQPLKAGDKEVPARELLGRTVLYKVGHHGSHNGTLKELGLELMTHRDLVAVVPVDKAMAAKKHWKMPFGTLYKRLLELTRGRTVLADAQEKLPAGEQLAGLTAQERTRFEENVKATGLFIDLTI